MTPLYFGALNSLLFLAFAYLGGISSVSGAVLGGHAGAGGVTFTAFEKWFSLDPNYVPAHRRASGLIFTAILNPEGIAGAFSLAAAQIRHLARAPVGQVATGGRGGRDRGERGRQLMALLETRDMTVTFGGLRAVDDVDLTVEQGQLVGLIGPNGAGKTTFIDGITGFVPTTGQHRVRRPGDLARCRPHQRAAPRPRPHVAVARAVRRPDRRPRTSRSPAERQSLGGFLADLVRRTAGARRERRRLRARRARPRRPRRAHAERAPPGPAQARRRRPGAGRPAASSSAWTSRPPASTPPSRQALGAPAARRSSTPASRSSSSTTTWASCSTCATTST